MLEQAKTINNLIGINLSKVENFLDEEVDKRGNIEDAVKLLNGKIIEDGGWNLLETSLISIFIDTVELDSENKALVNIKYSPKVAITSLDSKFQDVFHNSMILLENKSLVNINEVNVIIDNFVNNAFNLDTSNANEYTIKLVEDYSYISKTLDYLEIKTNKQKKFIESLILKLNTLDNILNVVSYDGGYTVYMKGETEIKIKLENNSIMLETILDNIQDVIYIEESMERIIKPKLDKIFPSETEEETKSWASKLFGVLGRKGKGKSSFFGSKGDIVDYPYYTDKIDVFCSEYETGKYDKYDETSVAKIKKICTAYIYSGLTKLQGKEEFTASEIVFLDTYFSYISAIETGDLVVLYKCFHKVVNSSIGTISDSNKTLLETLRTQVKVSVNLNGIGVEKYFPTNISGKLEYKGSSNDKNTKILYSGDSSNIIYINSEVNAVEQYNTVIKEQESLFKRSTLMAITPDGKRVLRNTSDSIRIKELSKSDTYPLQASKYFKKFDDLYISNKYLIIARDRTFDIWDLKTRQNLTVSGFFGNKKQEFGNIKYDHFVIHPDGIRFLVFEDSNCYSYLTTGLSSNIGKVIPEEAKILSVKTVLNDKLFITYIHDFGDAFLRVYGLSRYGDINIDNYKEYKLYDKKINLKGVLRKNNIYWSDSGKIGLITYRDEIFILRILQNEIRLYKTKCLYPIAEIVNANISNDDKEAIFRDKNQVYKLDIELIENICDYTSLEVIDNSDDNNENYDPMAYTFLDIDDIDDIDDTDDTDDDKDLGIGFLDDDGDDSGGKRWTDLQGKSIFLGNDGDNSDSNSDLSGEGGQETMDSLFGEDELNNLDVEMGGGEESTTIDDILGMKEEDIIEDDIDIEKGKSCLDDNNYIYPIDRELEQEDKDLIYGEKLEEHLTEFERRVLEELSSIRQQLKISNEELLEEKKKNAELMQILIDKL